MYEAVEGGTANVSVTVDGYFTNPFYVYVIPMNGTAIGRDLWFALQYVLSCAVTGTDTMQSSFMYAVIAQ